MERLDPKVQELFGKLGEFGAPPELVPGDPTKPASPEERVYWQKQNEYITKMVALMVGDPQEIAKAVNKYGSELFKFPSPDGSYEIEARFFRAEPSTSQSPPPLIAWFHGGGMTTLHRDAAYEMNTCVMLCRMGCSVLTPEFRNAREFHFPAGVDDCVDTVLWARANRDKLGVGDILVSAGCSGGGNLAVSTFVRAMERGLDANALIQGIYADAPNIRPKYTGVERIEAVEFAPMTPPNVLDDLANNYTQSLQDSMNPSAFPILATNEILAKFPPTMLRGEEFDTLREDAKELYERLAALKVPACSYAEYKNLIHGQFFMPSLVDKATATMLIGEIAGFAQALGYAA